MVFIVGCGPAAASPSPSLPAGALTTAIHRADGTIELRVVLLDGTGHARAIAPLEGEPIQSRGSGLGILRLADDQIGVGWVGGSCDSVSTFTLTPLADGRIELQLSTETQIPPGQLCDAAGHLRSVSIRFDGPIDLGSIVT